MSEIFNFLNLKKKKYRSFQNSNFYKAIIIIFPVSLPMVSINKFCKKEILIQPPGEPREQHLGDVGPKKLVLHKIS